MTLYQELLQAGFEMGNHCSDLYVPVNIVSTMIIAKHPQCFAQKFVSRLDGKLWYDIPFAYEPFWERKLGTHKQVANVKSVA